MNPAAVSRSTNFAYASAPQSPSATSTSSARDESVATMGAYLDQHRGGRAAVYGGDSEGLDSIAAQRSPQGFRFRATRLALPSVGACANQTTNMTRACGRLATSLGVTGASAYIATAVLPPLETFSSRVAATTVKVVVLAGIAIKKGPQSDAFDFACDASMGVASMGSVKGAHMPVAAVAYTAGLVGTLMTTSLMLPAGRLASWQGPLLSGGIGLIAAHVIPTCLPDEWAMPASFVAARNIVALVLLSAWVVQGTSRMAQAAHRPRELFDPKEELQQISLGVLGLLCYTTEFMAHIDDHRHG